MPDSSPKQIYIAKRAAELTDATYAARWRQHGSFVRSLPLWQHIRHYEQCLVQSAEDVGGVEIPGLDTDWDMVGMVWFRGPDSFSDAVAEPSVELVYADERETFLEPIAETTVFTQELVLRNDGGTKVKLVAFLKRKPGLTREEFFRHWEHTHAPLFLGVEEVAGHVVKYVQNHVLPWSEGPMAEYDGVVEIGFRSPEDVAKAFGHPAYMERIRPDEEQFVDLDSMVVVATDEALLYEDAL